MAVDLTEAMERMLAAAGVGVNLAAEHVLREARTMVPLEEGTLERSGRATHQGLSASVTFDTPYAVRQHEDMTARHSGGRSAKYLERAHTGEADTVMAIIGHAVQEATRGR